MHRPFEIGATRDLTAAGLAVTLGKQPVNALLRALQPRVFGRAAADGVPAKVGAPDAYAGSGLSRAAYSGATYTGASLNTAPLPSA